VRECGRMRAGCGKEIRTRTRERKSGFPIAPSVCRRVIKIAIDKVAVQSETIGMIKSCLVVCLLLTGCAAKKHPVATPAPPEVRSQLPPGSAEVIEHCVVTKQENANTVTCSCLPGTTVIDSRTGHTRLVCKKMKEETGSK
jgi:hypothetical protein